jgi:membrane glycosyltransferase
VAGYYYLSLRLFMQAMSWLSQHKRFMLFSVCSLSVTAGGLFLMYSILSANGLSLLESLLLVLFAFSFAWISSAFVTAVFGFILQLFDLCPQSLRRLGHHSDHTGYRRSNEVSGFKTAIIMPVYNEEVARVMAGIEATLESLISTGQQNSFAFYLLSDSTDEVVAEQEWRLFEHLRQRFAGRFESLFYRRRDNNEQRKVGNVAEFCRRFGGHYDAMLVLDADSVMSGRCMVELAGRMQANPNVGLIQTIPLPVRQSSWFGSFVQYAAHLCCSLLATGAAFWQTNNANYWGHNAIIRMRAFTEACGLPSIPGRGPFSGEILSHDFVEAALLKRNGWDVVLASDLTGSFEEVPANMIDYAARDRRWVKGNMQHLALLTTDGLSTVSRLHFFMGAVAYMSSAIWLLTLLLSCFDAISAAVSSNQFFTSAYQLFPHWPIAKTDEIQYLLMFTASLLLFPKLAALVIGLIKQRRDLGTWYQLITSTLIEMVLAVVIAPIMMIFHSLFVFSALSGVNVQWNSQPRHDRVVSWQEACQLTWLMPVAAILFGSVTYFYTPIFFLWLLPVLFGLALAPAVVKLSGSVLIGQYLARWGLLKINFTQEHERLLAQVDTSEFCFDNLLSATKTDEIRSYGSELHRQTGAIKAHLPSEYQLFMPIQRLHKRKRKSLATTQMAGIR